MQKTMEGLCNEAQRCVDANAPQAELAMGLHRLRSLHKMLFDHRQYHGLIQPDQYDMMLMSADRHVMQQLGEAADELLFNHMAHWIDAARLATPTAAPASERHALGRSFEQRFNARLLSARRALIGREELSTQHPATNSKAIIANSLR